MTRHARRTRRTDESRRWRRALLLFVLLLPLVPAGAIALARDDAASLDEAVSQAVRAEPERRVSGAVHVVEAIGRNGWSFGTAALPGTGGDDTPPEVVYYLARQSHGRWAAALESSAAFGKWARQAPAGVVPEVFLPAASDQVSAQGNAKVLGKASPQLSFPWAVDQTWHKLGGPHGHDQPDATKHPWAALDFNPDKDGLQSGEVLAAGYGFATTPCAVGSNPGPLVHIRHANGWETEYFHLANVPASASGSIDRGARLGDTSTETTGGGCSGTAPNKHVHFAVQRVQNGRTTKAELNGMAIGGYQIVKGKKAYDGCLVRRGAANPTAEQHCAGDAIENTGELQTGAIINLSGPSNALVSMKGKTIALKNFPSEESFTVSILYSPYGGSPSTSRDLGMVRTKSDWSANVKIAAPFVLRSGSVYLCAKGNEVNLFDCTKHRIVANNRQPL